MKCGEKMYLYGKRLMNIAQQRYDNDKEYARKVREHFLRTVPGAFADEDQTMEMQGRIEKGSS